MKKGATGVQLGEESARAMVLGGAAIVFANKGLRAASVEDILEAAGLSRRTFYRIYSSKEDVAEALYEFGIERLLQACKRAVEEEPDPLKQLERCIDAHLLNAREVSRLVFVLGGEAQRQESSLHARRMAAHETIVSYLAQSHRNVDPLMFRALLLSLEGVVRIVLEEGDEGRNVSDQSLARARKVMMRIATAAVAGEGERVAKLPLRSRARSAAR